MHVGNYERGEQKPAQSMQAERRGREVTKGGVLQVLQNSASPDGRVGTGIEFSGHNGRQDGALEGRAFLA